MKLFQCHAVLPLVGHEEVHVVTHYAVIAHTWQEARARVVEAEPAAEFVSVPCAVSDVHATGTTSISARELEDLRSACAWNETEAINEFGTSSRMVKIRG
ncbi:MAG: hypothetical protein ABI537_06425 [Casimicrobiaceae bacterium]